MTEHYSVTSIDELLRERTGPKRRFRPGGDQRRILAILFFSRADAFPRGLFYADCRVVRPDAADALFAAAIFRKRREWGKPTRILIIGADGFAQQSAECLERLSPAPCQIAGYVALRAVRRSERSAALSARSNRRAERRAGFRGGDHRHPSDGVLARAGGGRALEKLCCRPGPSWILAKALWPPEDGATGPPPGAGLDVNPRRSPALCVLKRAFDMAFSALVLALAAPLFGLIAILIRLTSPGPFFSGRSA